MKNFSFSKLNTVVIKHRKAIAWVAVLLLLIGLGNNLPENRKSIDKNDSDYNIQALEEIPIEDVIYRLNNADSHNYELLYDEVQSVELPSTPPIDWGWRFETNRSHNFNLHSWDMLNPLLLEYGRSKDRDNLEEAFYIALDWIENNEVSYENNQDSNFAWYDMAVGIRIYRLVYILEQSTQNGVGDLDEHRLLWQSTIDHLKYLEIDDNIIFHNNHGLYQAAGQKAAARRLKPVSSEFKGISSEASARLQYMLEQQFTDEGVHKEHSPAYHRMVYTTLLDMQREGLIDDDKSKRLLTRAGNVLYWMIKPNGVLANFGDTDLMRIPKDSNRYSDESAQELLYYISEGLDGRLPDPYLRAYSDSGFAVVKTPLSYLAQQAAFHSRTHKHADDLTFVWYDRGTDILIDSGKYGYLGRTEVGSEEWLDGFWYSDERRMYVESTRAHNTIEIDGRNYDRREREPFGSAIISSGEVEEGVYYIESEVVQFDTVVHNRLLIFKPGEWLIVLDLLDDEADEPRNYKQWFHFSDGLKVKQQNHGFSAQSEKLNETVHTFSLLGEENIIGPIIGEQEPRLQGWYSPQSNVFTPSPAVAFEVDGQANASFSTLFTFSSSVSSQVSDNYVNSNDGSASFSWRADKSSHRITIERGDSINIGYSRD